VTRHDDEFLRAIERLAVVLDEAGMPRMAARVYACMLIDGHAPYSAADLGDALQVSAPAVSGAMRVLVGGRLVVKEREPGNRVDHYRTVMDVWETMTRLRIDQLLTWHSSLEEAARILGPRTRGGRRMHQAAQFLAFSRERTLTWVQEWQEQNGPAVLSRRGRLDGVRAPVDGR